MVGGVRREMGLGRAGADLAAVPLADARRRAAEIYRLVRSGVDPLAQRAAEAATARAAEAATARARVHTFRQVADLYMAAHEAGWRNPVHRKQWRSTLEAHVMPEFGDKPVAAVAVGDVMGVLEPIWRTVPETASRLRGRVESVLDYAKARGWRDGENPARWKGHLANLLPARGKVARVEHHAALPWPEIAAFMATLREQPGTAAVAMQFAILTGARTGEAVGARWREIDLAAGVWTVPPERMKAHREHRVPLSHAARDVLATMAHLQPAGGDGYVFPGAKLDAPLSNMAMLSLLRRMGRGDLTTHGFRSTFRDWAAEATNYPREVAEQALAHTLSDKVEAAYRRGDLFAKRAAMMNDWAGHCGLSKAKESERATEST